MHERLWASKEFWAESEGDTFAEVQDFSHEDGDASIHYHKAKKIETNFAVNI